MNTNTGESLISVGEAANRLGLSEHTIRKYVQVRSIPFVKIGARVLFAPRDLDQFVEDRRFKAVDR